MKSALRCLMLGGLLAAVVACDDGAQDPGGPGAGGDYLALTPEQVCELLSVDEATKLMRPITEDKLTMKGEDGNSPGCRYGAGEGKAYLNVKILQSSMMGKDEEDGDEKVTVAGQEAVQMRPSSGCSVAITLEPELFLVAIAESWESGDEESCAAARGALDKAYPRLSA
ncbi:MAG: DUF3558 family protein [Thermocrispum sp.]